MTVLGAFCGSLALLADPASGGALDIPPSDVASEVLVDELVAIVDKEPITRSEVLAEAEIVWIEQGGSKALRRAREDLAGDGFLARIVDLVVKRALVVAEARRFQFRAVPETEVHRSLARFEQQFATRDEYLRWLARQEMDEADLCEILFRARWADAFLEARLRPKVLVPEAEVQRCYEEAQADAKAETEAEADSQSSGPGSSTSRASAESLQAVRASLEASRFQSELTQYVAELTGRYRVYVVPRYRMPLGTAEPPPRSPSAQLGRSCRKAVKSR